MAESLYTRFLAALKRVPRGWQILGAMLASWALLILIMWGVSLIARGGECHNTQVTAGDLPPKQYRHEPYMSFEFRSRNFLDNMTGEKGSAGVYLPKSRTIYVCAGLTGDALRIIRMHEEAHALYGWRH